MDPGGGARLLRRPGSLFLRFLFHLVLLLSPPSSISLCRITGESVTTARAHLHSPPTSPTVSMVRAQGESPSSKTDGSFRNSRSRTNLSDLSLQISISPSVSVGPRCSICCNSETFTPPGSGFDELWSLDSERFYSHVQLGKLCFWTSMCLLFPYLTVCHSQALRPFPHTGKCNHRVCSPRRDRYNFLRSIIPNIMTKFLVDDGVSVHEIDGVPDFVGIVVLSPDLCYRIIWLFKQGDDDYRRLMVFLTGLQVSVLFSSLALEVSFNDLRGIEVAKSDKTRICSEVMPESYRRCEEIPMAALSVVENLGQTAPVGFGPNYVFNGPYYQKGFNPRIKNTQRKNHRIDLGFKFTYRASVWCFKSDIFCNVGLTNRMESLDSLNLIM